MFFDDWTGIWRTVAVGALAYVALILLLRVSGKRTLSKLNAFDLVVTVALGSTLATILLSSDVALAEGVTALGLLIFLQYAAAWLSVRYRAVEQWVKADPRLLFHHGEFLRGAMRQERVTEAEVTAAVRAQGYAELEQVGAVVLETDGSFTVLQRADGAERSTLAGVRGARPAARRGRRAA